MTLFERAEQNAGGEGTDGTLINSLRVGHYRDSLALCFNLYANAQYWPGWKARITGQDVVRRTDRLFHVAVDRINNFLHIRRNRNISLVGCRFILSTIGDWPILKDWFALLSLDKSVQKSPPLR